MTITAEEIIYQYCQGRLFPDPEYYAGHGNDPRDLNSSILELVYQGVLTEKGPAAAKAFVNMVKNLKDTNAKNFLLEYYRLEKKSWRYGDPVLKVRVAPAGQASPAKAEPVLDYTKKPEDQVVVKRVTEVLNAFKRGASSVGHDKAITSDFLSAHKGEVDSSMINSSFGGGAS
jgi:hypothetical protein